MLAPLIACEPAPRAQRAALIEMRPPAIALEVGDAPRRVSAIAYDSALHPLLARPAITSRDPGIARVSSDGRVHAIAPGNTTLVARHDGAESEVAVVVRAPSSRAIGPDVVVLDVVPHARFQTISGWEATAGIGLDDCDTVAVERYRGAVLERAVNELGLTRLRLELPSGIEQRVNLFAQRRAGTLPFAAWKDVRYRPVNDDADPFHIDSAGFQWAWLDDQVRRTVTPLQQAMAARGERLFVNLEYVDFTLGTGEKRFLHMKAPEEYAELIEATFVHLHDTYGWVPDAVEATLEPEHTLYTASDIALSINAAAARLVRHGWRPEFIAPSTTSVANAVRLYDEMLAVPGVGAHVREIAYHRYQHVSAPALAELARRARRDGVRTAMLEHIGADIDELFDDLLNAQASAWEQYSIAYCAVPNASDGGSFYKFDERDPTFRSITLSSGGRVLANVFRHVRPGATRIGVVSRDSAAADAIAFADRRGATTVVARSRAGARVRVRGLPEGSYMASVVSRRGIAGGRDEGERRVQVGADGELAAMIPARAVLVVYPSAGSTRASRGASSAQVAAQP